MPAAGAAAVAPSSAAAAESEEPKTGIINGCMNLYLQYADSTDMETVVDSRLSNALVVTYF